MITLTLSPVEGDTVTATATITNNTAHTLRSTALYLVRWGDSAAPLALGGVRPGRTVTRSRRITLPAGAEGKVDFVAHAVYDVTARSSDFARASASLTLPYRTLRGSFDNAGIANDSNHTGFDFDGSGSSLSAQALASAGLSPGATITRDGFTFTWPDTTPGQKDNVVSTGQTVLLTGSGARLGFLGTSTWGEGKGTGTVHYADGTSQEFSVAVPDWYGTNPAAAVVAPYRLIASGRDDTPVSIFAFSVPLQGKQLHSVVLPKVGTGLQPGVPALHIFAVSMA